MLPATDRQTSWGCTVKQISDNEIYLLIKYVKKQICVTRPQCVNTVKGNNPCLFSDPHKTYKCTVRQKAEFLIVKLVVHIETTALQRAKMTVKVSKPVSTCMQTDIYYLTAKPYYLTLCATEIS